MLDSRLEDPVSFLILRSRSRGKLGKASEAMRDVEMAMKSQKDNHEVSDWQSLDNTYLLCSLEVTGNLYLY